MFGFLKRGEDSEGSPRGKEEAKPAKEGDKCKLCGDHFSFINLKHQCRKCGNFVCGSCSTGKMYVRGFNENQRVCDDCMQEKMQQRGKTFTSPGLEKRKKKELEEKRKESGEAAEVVAASGHKKSKIGSADSRLVNAFKDKGWTGWEEESVKPPHLRTKMAGDPSLAAGASPASPNKVGRGGEKQSKVPARKTRTMDDKDFAGDLQQLGWQDDPIDGPAAAAPQRDQAAAPLKGSLGRLHTEIKDLKREALAFKKEGRKAEAMEALKKAKVKEAELAELQMIGASDEDEDGEEEDPELAEAMAVAEREMKNRPKGDADMDPAALMKAIAEMGEGENEEVSDGSDVDEDTAADLQELGLETRIRKKAGVPKKPGRKAPGSGAVPGGEADLLADAMRAINNENDEVEITDGDLDNPEWASQLGELGWQHEDGEEHEHCGDPLPPPPVAPSAQRAAAPVGVPKGKSKAELEKEMKTLKLKMLKLRKEKKMDEWKLEVEKVEKLQEQLNAFDTLPTAARLPPPPPQLFKENSPSITRPPRGDANEPLPVPVPERAGRTSEHAAVGDDQDDFDRRLRALRGGEPKVVEGPARVAAPQPPLEEVHGSNGSQVAGAAARSSRTAVSVDSLAAEPAEQVSPPPAQRQRPSAQSSVTAASTASANSGRHAEAPVVVSAAPVVSLESLEKELLVRKKKALTLMKARRMDEWREAIAGIEELQEEIEAAQAKAAKARGPSAASGSKVGVGTVGAVDSGGSGTRTSRRAQSVDSNDRGGERASKRAEIAELKRRALALKTEGKKSEALDQLRKAKQLELQLEGSTAGAPPAASGGQGPMDPADAELRDVLKGAGVPTAPAPAVGGSRAGAQDLPRPSPNAGGEKQRKHLENRIRAEKLKVLQLVQAGRTEEARQATRAVRLLEQQLKSLQ